MKRTVKINYACKRTYNLGDFENIAPIYTAEEVIELDEGEEFTKEDFHVAMDKLKSFVRDELAEEMMRVKRLTENPASASQMCVIFSWAKTKKLDLDEVCQEEMKKAVTELTCEEASQFINHLKNYEGKSRSNKSGGGKDKQKR